MNPFEVQLSTVGVGASAMKCQLPYALVQADEFLALCPEMQRRIDTNRLFIF